MSDKPYIAEFHDLAKLLDKDALGALGIKVRGQRFDGIDYGASSLSKPACPSWYAPYCEDLKDLDSKVARDCGKWAADVFLTRIADRLASSFRLTEFEEPIDKRTRTLAGWRKIWKDQIESPDWGGSLISSKEAFCSLLEFWDRCANSDEVIEYFKRALSAIPEDKAPPYNITSLHSHLRLVGMIYRVLRGAVKTLPAGLSLGGKDVSQATQAMGGRVDGSARGNWIGTLTLVDVGIRQHLSRLRDLNVFVKREHIMREIESTFPDHVLYRTPDSLLLFTVSGGGVEPRHLIAPLLQEGFPLGVQHLEAELELLVSDFERQWLKFHSSKGVASRHFLLRQRPLSEAALDVLQGKICEVCQMAPSLPQPWVKDQIEEWLCEGCTGIRQLHEPATDISDWQGATLWVKVSLDRRHLTLLLPSLFERYVTESLPGIKPDEAHRFVEAFRPLAAETDFIRDYQAFVQEFQGQLCAQLKGLPTDTAIPWSYVLGSYPELTVLPIVSNCEFLIACETFISNLHTFFPRCCGYAPITLALSLSPGKYPYQEHWRFLTRKPDPKRPISIQRAFDFDMALSFPQFRALRDFLDNASAPTNASLHHLAALESDLDSPTAILFEAFKNQRMRPALRLLLFQHEVSIETILGFYKLMTWQEASHAG